MIEIGGLDKHFRGKRRSVHVIDDVSVTIPGGSFFTLLGPSGSGKTTMLRVIAGLERHDGGQVSIGGKLVSDAARGLFVPPSQRGIGMVFQSYAIWPNMDVFGNVAYPLRVQRGRPTREEMRRRVGEVLAVVGLGDLIDAPASALSGGQQQRVALARALVGRPNILLLDEPLSNLDAQLRERMRIEIRDIQRKLGITTVYVTHDRAEALSMSTLVAVMNKGRIEMVGTPAEVYERPRTGFTADFLGTCNRLSGRVRSIDAEGLAVVETEDGALACRIAPEAVGSETVTVLVRPEDIELSATPNAASWGGTLAGLTYYGDRAECLVRLGSREITTFGHPSLAAFLGKPVALGFRSERCWALRDGA